MAFGPSFPQTRSNCCVRRILIYRDTICELKVAGGDAGQVRLIQNNFQTDGKCGPRKKVEHFESPGSQMGDVEGGASG